MGVDTERVERIVEEASVEKTGRWYVVMHEGVGLAGQAQSVSEAEEELRNRAERYVGRVSSDEERSELVELDGVVEGEDGGLRAEMVRSAKGGSVSER